MTDVFPGAKLVQLNEWGYPQGALRSTPPVGKAFSVIHITGNSRLPSAENEAAWRLNDPANQNSATFFVNRDGSIVQTLGDPLHMDPWANGDLNRPDTSNRRIAAVVADSVNANTRTLVAIENVGYEPGSSITAAQEDACARIIAYYHVKAGVNINRTAVVGHYQLNSVTRPNCPAVDKSVIDRIVAKARGEGTTAEIEDPAVIAALQDQVTSLSGQLEACRSRFRSVRNQRDALAAQLVELEAELAAALADDATDTATIRRLRDRVKLIKALVATMATDIAEA